MIDEKNNETTEETTENEEVKQEETKQEEKQETAENNKEASEDDDKKDELDMLRKNKEEIKKLTNQVETLKDRFLRLTAEYENYRKRTTKEKEGIYTDACADVLKEVLPTLDNLERAYAADGSVEDLKKGIEMTMKGLQSSFEKLGVEEIPVDEGFDPNLHQAVMHVEDENLDKNVVAEVFMKGYKKGDKVIRHTVVKVAN
ncbi:MAG: nucleotide exchange factor GrpE [Clostridium sp.]|nr:nucleotide exchange factor GrpE [Clostridium sp.]